MIKILQISSIVCAFCLSNFAFCADVQVTDTSNIQGSVENEGENPSAASEVSKKNYSLVLKAVKFYMNHYNKLSKESENWKLVKENDWDIIGNTKANGHAKSLVRKAVDNFALNAKKGDKIIDEDCIPDLQLREQAFEKLPSETVEESRAFYLQTLAFCKVNQVATKYIKEKYPHLSDSSDQITPPIPASASPNLSVSSNSTTPASLSPNLSASYSDSSASSAASKSSTSTTSRSLSPAPIPMTPAQMKTSPNPNLPKPLISRPSMMYADGRADLMKRISPPPLNPHRFTIKSPRPKANRLITNQSLLIPKARDEAIFTFQDDFEGMRKVREESLDRAKSLIKDVVDNDPENKYRLRNPRVSTEEEMKEAEEILKTTEPVSYEEYQKNPMTRYNSARHKAAVRLGTEKAKDIAREYYEKKKKDQQ